MEKRLDVERQKSDNLLLNILPRSIAKRLKDGEATIADKHPSVSVLFADIVGFTQLSERVSPEELVIQLNELFSGLDEIADAFGLEKIKTIGDAYMISGGISGDELSHQEAIARFALATVDHVARYSDSKELSLQIRIGIHTGPVVAGVIGKRKFAYDLWGDTVNVASRMESSGVVGRIQVTPSVVEATAQVFDFEPRGKVSIKGKGDMEVFLLA